MNGRVIIFPVLGFLFQPWSGVRPCKIEVIGIRGDQVIHANDPDVKTNHIGIMPDRITVLQVRILIGHQPHFYRLFFTSRFFVVFFVSFFSFPYRRPSGNQFHLAGRRNKIQIVGANAPVLRKKVQSKRIIRPVKQNQRQGIMGLVIFQFDRTDLSPFCRQADSDQIILEGDNFFFPGCSLAKSPKTIRSLLYDVDRICSRRQHGITKSLFFRAGFSLRLQLGFDPGN